MHTQLITQEDQWNQIITIIENPPFLQSWEWGEFQKELGNTVVRLAVSDGETVVAFAQCYLVRSKLTQYLYCPRGPYSKSPDAFDSILQEITTHATPISADFILIEPDNRVSHYISGQTKLLKQAYSTQPQHTSIIQLIPDIDSLWQSIRKTSRALIKKATQSSVKITSYKTPDHFEAFAKLFTETVQRQRFVPHSLQYIKKQFTLFAQKNHVTLYCAEVEGTVIAAAIILMYGKTATYLHAASSYEGRKSGAPHLLIWNALQQAKEEGCTQFDLWGIAADNDPNDPWAGITIFKNGFGGQPISYPGSFVIPIHWIKYRLYRISHVVRKMLRRMK